jgi:flagellin
MPLTLGTNINALRAQRQLSGLESSLGTVFERLSSGQRINRASDDAAGLAISSELNADGRVYGQAIRNVNDGVSLLNIADSTLEELTSIVTRIKELATQSANGSVGGEQRQAIDAEAQALSAEFFRVSRSSEFNGIGIFDGELEALSLQLGYGTDGSIFGSLGGDLGTGTFDTGLLGASYSFDIYDLATADINGDGILDVVTSVRGAGLTSVLNIHIGNGDGTFSDVASIGVSGLNATIDLGDLDGDGDLDLVAGTISGGVFTFDNEGAGSFSEATTILGSGVYSGVSLVDLDGDGASELMIGSSSRLYTYSNDGTGNLSLNQTINSGEGTFQASEYADLNGDGILDAVFAYDGDPAGRGFQVLIGNGDGTFSLGMSRIDFVQDQITGIALEDFDGDGDIDIAFSTGSGGFGGGLKLFDNNSLGVFSEGTAISTTDIQSVQSADINGDGLQDLIALDSAGRLRSYLNEGNGAFSASQTLSLYSTVNGEAFALGDFDGDGVYDVISGDESLTVNLGSTREGLNPILDFSLLTQADALQALGPLDRKLDSLSRQRGVVGALQSRIGSALNNLYSLKENYSAAESRIVDADIARETSELTRLQVLRNASTAILSQANTQPELALQLLR